MNRPTLLIVGAGGFGRALAEVAIADGRYEIAGFVDDRWPDLAPVAQWQVLGRIADIPALRRVADVALIAIGDNLRREAACSLAAASGYEVACLVHPRAIVSPSAELAPGVSVMAAAIVGCEAVLERGAIVGAGSIVDHHARVGAFAHVSAGACMTGGSQLGARSWLQEGRSLAPGQVVPDDTVISRYSLPTHSQGH